MKRLTTIVCCIALMIYGVSIAFFEKPNDNRTITAATISRQATVSGDVSPKIPLVRNEGLSHGSSIKDSINIIDSVRIVTKTKWKIRYKNVADRTTAREAGQHLAAVTPDSLSKKPAIISTAEREEQPAENVCSPNEHSIQLIVDGQTVYSKDDNHSTGEGQ